MAIKQGLDWSIDLVISVEGDGLCILWYWGLNPGLCVER
jgi:hypothetical protein